MNKPMFDIQRNVGKINIENVQSVGKKPMLRLGDKDIELEPNKKYTFKKITFLDRIKNIFNI